MGEQDWLAEVRELFQQSKLEAALKALDHGLQEASCIDGWELKNLVLPLLQRYGEAAEANGEVLKLLEAGAVSSPASWLVSAEDFLKIRCLK